MDNLAKWFLKQKSLTIFLLSILVFPFYLWMFSVIYQLEKNENSSKKWIVAILFITLYPILYMFFLIGFLLFDSRLNFVDTFKFILPFHIIAGICGLVLSIICSNSIVKFEKQRNYKTFGGLVTFLLLCYYIVGVWIIQPNLNKYIEE